MIRAIIVEDEVKSGDLLQSIVAEVSKGEVEIVSVCRTCEEAIQKINTQQPDLVFLDIELPDNNGFYLLEQFPQANFSVIFTTAFDHYAIKAFRYSALDYLLKPIDEDDCYNAIERFKHYNRAEQKKSINNIIENYRNKEHRTLQKLALPSVEGLDFVVSSDIVKLIADSNYTHVYTQEKKVVVSKTLKYFEEILDPELFIRIHHGSIVSIRFILKYHKGRGGYVELTDGSTLEVSSRRVQEFKEKFKL